VCGAELLGLVSEAQVLARLVLREVTLDGLAFVSYDHYGPRSTDTSGESDDVADHGPAEDLM
jgi:hypothetical protein